ncbi:ABC transporter substrate-binding protein [Tardiphaga sp. 215_C5_N2_1]|uniref:ABC transporter substrate-binding protein n=1 Tax=Tardiphaga sp. 215_C5_N2_1 TaxID=3240774 RepID=UPI003F8C7A1B
MSIRYRCGVLRRSALVATALIGGMLLGTLPSRAEERVVVATAGGSFERALRTAWFDPFTKATGIKVISVVATDAEQRARASAMVRAGRVEWDIFNNHEILAASSGNRAITEDLSQFCAPYVGSPKLSAGTCSAAGLRFSRNATTMVFNKEAFAGAKPSSWADFWDVEKFPGRRALPSFGDPWRVLAAALLADGVSPSNLFPLDVDRAFKKLDTIRRQIDLWWRTGDQSQQGFRNRDYVLGMLFAVRANTLRDEGQPIEVSFNQAFMIGDSLQVIKGAQNREAALKLLKFYMENPDIQARYSELTGVVPPSDAALALLSTEAKTKLPAAGAATVLIEPNLDWLNANQAMLVERWNAWIQ